MVLGVVGLVAILVVVRTPTKFVSGFLDGRVYGLNARRSKRVAVALTTRGEFSLSIAAVALAGAGPSLTPAQRRTIYAFAVGSGLATCILGSLRMQCSSPLDALATAVRRF